MNNPHDIILKPLITERSMMQAEEKNIRSKLTKMPTNIRLKMRLKRFLM